jgi:hypothetical protein
MVCRVLDEDVAHLGFLVWCSAKACVDASSPDIKPKLSWYVKISKEPQRSLWGLDSDCTETQDDGDAVKTLDGRGFRARGRMQTRQGAGVNHKT